MSEYVEALLSLARISQASLDIEEVDLSAMASALFDELQRESPGRRVACSIQPQMYADGDATLLRLLLQNLLGNAFKFTGRKSRAEISLYSELASDGRIVYCVRDNGVGFDAAQAHRLFGTFQRLHRQADFPGTGIGLANAKRIVERHGGTIWAASDSGRGTSFMFTLGESIAVTRY
jgi:signal transduction histidine kinase